MRQAHIANLFFIATDIVNEVVGSPVLSREFDVVHLDFLLGVLGVATKSGAQPTTSVCAPS